MGHPKKQRKKSSRPFRPYDKTRIEKEKKIMKDFGLRRKREIRIAESLLRNLRGRARDLQGSYNEKDAKALFDKVIQVGLVNENVTLDDILDIKLENVLSRRLQTVVHKKGFANTVKHARQMIVHGQIHIGHRRVVYPSYMVHVEEEGNIKSLAKKGVAE